MPGLPSRVSWFFLLLFGNGVCSPALIKEPRHPYSGQRHSAGEPSLGPSGTESKVPLPPLVTLRHEPKPLEPASATGVLPSHRPRTQHNPVGYNSSSDPGGPPAPSPLQSQFLGLTKKTPGVSSTGAGPAKLSSKASYPVSEANLRASTFTSSRFLQRYPWGRVKEGFSPVLPAFFPAQILPPRRDFPDLKLWASRNLPLSSGDPPHMPPPSYIVQSRTMYQRAREVFSHTKYSNDFGHLLQSADSTGEILPGTADTPEVFEETKRKKDSGLERIVGGDADSNMGIVGQMNSLDV